MAGLESLVFFAIVPVVAWAIEILVIRSAYEAAQRDLAARGQVMPASRMYVLEAYGAVPFVLGLVLWFLSLPITDRIDVGDAQGFPAFRTLVVWSAVIYGIAAIVTLAARASVLRSRFSGLMGTDVGRVMPIAVIPFTGTVFAMVLAFLVLGYVDGAVYRSQIPRIVDVDAAVAALQAYAVATLGLLAGALASNRIRDFSLRGFQRALLVAVMGEVPALLGLVWAFLAIGNL